MSKLGFVSAFAATLALSAAAPVDAGTISGSFTGIVTDSNGMPGAILDGQTVSGSFGTKFTTCPPGPNPYYSCFVPQMTVSFLIAGVNYSFGQYNPLNAFRIDTNPTGQLLTLYPDLGDPHGYVMLTLAGPRDAFVTGTDYVNLHPGPVIVSDSHASLIVREGPALGIQFTGVQLDGVPEPATWAMLITGYGLVGLGMRTRQRSIAS